MPIILEKRGGPDPLDPPPGSAYGVLDALIVAAVTLIVID